MENKCSGPGERGEGGLSKGLAAVLYTIRPQTDCWKRNDGGGCKKDVYSLTDADTVLNRAHNDLLKQAALDLDCVSAVHPPSQASPRGC
jgi:hypothetical protein